MPSNTTQQHQRVVVAQFTLDMQRVFGEAYFKTERFGSRTNYLLPYAGLFIGQVEGRPLNASKLAEFSSAAFRAVQVYDVK